MPSGEHKSYPPPPEQKGLWTFTNRSGKAKCGRFDPSDWPKLVDALRDAIRSGLVHEDFTGDFPRRVWVYINGVLHEARLSNATLGQYHGFPLEYEEQRPSDPDGLLKDVPRVTITEH